MAYKIYFGSVVVFNDKTKETRVIDRQLFTERDNLTDEKLRGWVLKNIPPKERINYKIVELCFDTAKYLGDTAY